MNCSTCGQTLPAEATFCPGCGTAVAPPVAGGQTIPSPPSGSPPGVSGYTVPGPPQGAGSRPPPPEGPSAFGAASQSKGSPTEVKFDASNLNTRDWLTGVGSLVLLISVFLPWYTVSLGSFGSASASGVGGHGWLWIVFFLSLAVVAYEAIKLFWRELPFDLPVPEASAVLAVTAVNFVLTLLAFAFKAGTGAPTGFHVSIGWGIGAFLGLIAAVVAAAPWAVPAIQSRTGPPTR
jgi:hypothetical protein